MRALPILLTALGSLGCSLVLDPGIYLNGPGTDGGTDTPDTGPAVACDDVAACTGATAPVCVEGECFDCDGDADGYLSGDARCHALRGAATADCEDARGDVHPGAEVVCGDGAVNDCGSLSTDVATALGAMEVGVLPSVTLYESAADVVIEMPRTIALQSSGGEINAAVVVRAHEADGDSVAWLVAFDHTAPAPTTPVPVATSGAAVLTNVESVSAWVDSPTAATFVVDAQFIEGGVGLSTPHFGQLIVGSTTAVADPVEPDRAACPYDTVVASSWSDRQGWYSFIGRHGATETHALHTVSASGPLGCVDLGENGIRTDGYLELTSAGDRIFINDQGGVGYRVWTPDWATIGNEVEAPLAAAVAVPAAVNMQYLLAGQSGASRAHLAHLDCNVAMGCSILSSEDVETLPGWDRRLVRWGASAALLTRYADAPDGAGQRDGVQLQILDTSGALLGGESDSRVVAETRYPSPAERPSELRWFDAVLVPRATGAENTDVLVTAVRMRGDTTMSIEVARIRSCRTP